MLAHADIEDLGPRQARAARERTCVVTRAVKPVDELIRFVVAPDGAVVPDLKRRLPGRGVWVTASRAAVDDAVRRNGFSRGFKRAVRAARRPFGARSSGNWSARPWMRSASPTRPAGSRSASERPKATLAGGPVAAILQAADASPDGVRKIAAAAARRQAGTNAAPIPVVTAFTTAQLDLALGRSNVVHAALLAGPASNGFLARCQSLERFRTIAPGGRGTG